MQPLVRRSTSKTLSPSWNSAWVAGSSQPSAGTSSVLSGSSQSMWFKMAAQEMEMVQRLTSGACSVCCGSAGAGLPWGTGSV